MPLSENFWHEKLMLYKHTELHSTLKGSPPLTAAEGYIKDNFGGRNNNNNKKAFPMTATNTTEDLLLMTFLCSAVSQHSFQQQAYKEVPCQTTGILAANEP